MSILQEIQVWGTTLPSWQQDAISRLFSQGTLTADDDAEIYSILKANFGIPDPLGLAAKTLTAEQVSAPQQKGSVIKLHAIRDLQHVNALATGQRLAFAETGITVIYGDNGSGKSGYSRAFKKACRARDSSEPILPNAQLAPPQTGKPSAIFEVAIDAAEPTALTWTEGVTSPAELSSISIFDAHCARAYLDEQGDFSYSPYGLDILSGLAQLCGRLKTKIEAEQTVQMPVLTPFSHLLKGETAVSSLITGLNATTKPAAVHALATLTKEEQAELSQIEKSLKEDNPIEKAKRLNNLATRLIALADRCEAKGKVVSDEAVAELQLLVQASTAAKEAARIASESFKSTPGLLPGTGNDAWQALFAAAKTFAIESHPHRQFPVLEADDLCPLCQEPVEASGAARLQDFEAFVSATAEKNAREARDFAIKAYKGMIDADIATGLDSTLQDEIGTLDAPLAKTCSDYETWLTDRIALVKKAVVPEGDWTALGLEIANPGIPLRALSEGLKLEALTLEKVSDAAARALLEKSHAALHARSELDRVKDAVIDAISKYVFQAALHKCMSAVRTNSISNKATELNDKIVSKNLATALNHEFKNLGVDTLRVQLKPIGIRGKTYYKLAFEFPGQHRPTMILSEGEQRAIAIASFLAEVNISGSSGGVTFDDPVSSLDHKRRWLVAKRLAEEAAHRQVIVFTHDLYFLLLMQQEAKDRGIPINPYSLRRTSAGFGVASDTLPFAGSTTAKRVRILRDAAIKCQALHKAGDEEAAAELVGLAYFKLRIAWERAVEEVLFRGVVMRFSEGVSTQMLSEVEVLDSDYQSIEAGMTKCSKFAHDGAVAANVPTPHPDELVADIEVLEEWRKSIEIRKEVTRKRRKLALNTA